MNNYNIPRKYQVLDGNMLKIIACFTMLADHINTCLIYQKLYIRGAYFAYGINLEDLHKVYTVLYMVGRATFPLIAFLMVEGFLHTKSKAKYALRLLILGLVSEIPYNLCLYDELRYPANNNVCFTLFLGLISLWSWEKLKDRWCIRLPMFALMFIAARQLHTDYGWRGILLIFIFYLLHTWRIPQVLLGLISMYWEYLSVILGFLPLLFYNGKRGRQLKYFFYLFYPVHMVILYIVSKFL